MIGRRWRGRCFGAAVVAVAVLGAPTLASADDGLRMDGATTYEARPEAGVVRVTVDLQLTNTKPDRRTDEGVTQYYFTGFRVPVPASATNAVARRGDGVVPVELVPTEQPGVAFAEVDLPSNLFYGQTQQWRLELDLVGSPPRSDDPSRVNQAHVSFPVFPIGDPGRADVTVRVPSNFTVETVGTDVTPTLMGEAVVEAADIADPESWYVFVSARDDARLVSTEVEVGDVIYRVRSWPGDEAWAAFMSDSLTRGVPLLERLIGSSWPDTGTVEILESATPLLQGYDGWFDTYTNQVEVVDRLDQVLVLHELAHAWFNQSMFTERWISEGLAEEYSSRAVVDLGGEATARAPVDLTSPGAQPLEQWTVSASGEADDADRYGYAGSGQVIKALLDEIGIDKMAAVLEAAAEDQVAYAGDAPPEYAGPGGSRRFLDLLQEIGGSATAEHLFRDWVLDDEGDAELVERAKARAAYAALGVRAEGWAAPLGLRRAMADWRFDDADRLLSAAAVVLDKRDELVAALEPLGLAVPGELEERYESTSFEPELVGEDLDRYRQVATEITAARDTVERDRGWLATVGLWGSEPDALVDEAVAAYGDGELDEATLLAAEAAREIEGADDAGRSRVVVAAGSLLALVVLVLGTVVVIRRVRRSRRQRAATAGIDVADAVDAADVVA